MEKKDEEVRQEKMEDYIASIEVAYPETWTVEYEMIDS